MQYLKLKGLKLATPQNLYLRFFLILPIFFFHLYYLNSSVTLFFLSKIFNLTVDPADLMPEFG